LETRILNTKHIVRVLSLHNSKYRTSLFGNIWTHIGVLNDDRGSSFFRYSIYWTPKLVQEWLFWLYFVVAKDWLINANKIEIYDLKGTPILPTQITLNKAIINQNILWVYRKCPTIISFIISYIGCLYHKLSSISEYKASCVSLIVIDRSILDIYRRIIEPFTFTGLCVNCSSFTWR